MVQQERVEQEVEREGKVVRTEKAERAVEGDIGVKAEGDNFPQVYQ